MVQPQRLTLENKYRDEREDGQRDELLDYLQLPEIERPTVVNVADTVRRHHETVFKQSDAPAEQNHHRQGKLAEPGGLLQMEVAVPGKRHEDI